MLASIVPLVERARNRRWGLTVAAYVLGSVVGGALLGGASGVLGAVLLAHTGVDHRLLLAAGAATCIAGAAFDLGVAGLSVPTVRRQVNQDWLHRYRGWVYGLGFGVQLGLGVVTIVTTATVYLVFVLGFLSASWPAAVAFGAGFGLSRALPVVTTARVATPARLAEYHRRMQSWTTIAGRAAVGVEFLVAAVAAVAVAGAVKS